ncbi:unnamed protein product [Durusdinium trenchii]|uniref:Tyrosine-protein kinase ephrin type A/B receptor-like domain-containing protein n=1 Tax=Durusdinium trenchii TaxID=1381693 RepID=A0ABP0RA66_9DINO
MLCLLILSTVFTIADGRVCLPDAVPEDQRQNITMMGKSMPLGVAAGNWDSALAARDVYAILVEEILGYNAEIQPTPSTVSTLRLLAGCKDSEAEIENCSFPPIAHVGMELWGSSLQSAAMLQKLKLLGERNPEILGSMGYWGVEGMYVLGKARQRALDDAGLHLSYYGNLNASWFHPENYAANLTEVNFTNLRTCDGWTNDPLGAQQYLEATGDADGVVQEDGKTKYKCWENKWWLPPACRASPWNCMSLITGGTGWGLAELTQQISSHNMPMAFAVATDNAKWREENKKLQGFLYWWSPDSSFVAYSPALVEMPPWSLFEHKQGIYKSQIDRVELHMAVARGLDAVADRAYGLAQNLHISDSIMNELLLTMVQSATPDDEPWQTACTWLRANRIIWQEWVPDKTVCSVGRGLVDLQGEFVTARADAVDCAICPSGYASTEISETRVCSKCEPGTYQRTFGTSECNPCDLGHIAPSEGSAECEQCGLGEYANATGMSLCHRCGMGSGEEHLWTTSREINSGGEVVVIQLLGAVSQSFCTCGAGTFLWDGRCQVCMEGSSCPGSNRLELLPGYFSSPEAPGEIYNCFDERVCPGGPPGTCAQGRDASSVACARCQDGFQERGAEKTCDPCREGDYAFFFLVICTLVGGVGLLHIVLMNETASNQRTSLLVVFSSLTQFITVVQMLSVLRRFGIDWREPFASVLIFLEILSFDFDMLSINCVTSLSPVATFSFRALIIPLLMFMALVVHLCYLLCSRSSTFKFNSLLRTMGSIFLILFIVLWSMLLAPFQCNQHPNGKMTMKRYKTVFCDGNGEHMEMFIMGGLASSMPVIFLALCIWAVVIELPKRVARSDTHFLITCSFLTKRFRPGMEMASIVLLLRNALVVMCPLVTTTAGQLMLMGVILYLNLAWVAYFKPWRFPICNLLDVALLGGMLVILQMGSITVDNSHPEASMFVVMTFIVFMALAVLAAVGSGLYRYFQQKFKKQFRFFTCHQKNAAGSMARLLKMELEARLPRTKTFIDCDDLNDLTRLFSYVGQDTETFLVLCSPAILTRKWCVGEMVTARANRVSTLLLTWPDFTLPDETFIENYVRVVLDIVELTKYNISISDVEETFKWLCAQNHVAMPEQLSTMTVNFVLSDLIAESTPKKKEPVSGRTRGKSLFGGQVDTGFPILADPFDTESVATGMVLATLLKPRLLGTDLPLPAVLPLGEQVSENARRSLVICSKDCFKSEHIQTWLLQACSCPGCCMIPVIAEDAFMMPSDAFFTELASKSVLDEQQLQLYVTVIKALFQEIAVVFVPQSYSSTQDDLELRASQAALRLTATLQPLGEKAQKLAKQLSLRRCSCWKIMDCTNETPDPGRATRGRESAMAAAEIPKMIASKLLQGWCMLNKSCEKDLAPLLRSRDGQELCVACEIRAAVAEGPPPVRCFLPEVAAPEPERTEDVAAVTGSTSPLLRKQEVLGSALWEVTAKGPAMKFCCTRLVSQNGQRPRLVADSFAVKVRLGAAVGVDSFALQEATAVACRTLMHKIMLPKPAGGSPEIRAANGQMSVIHNDKTIFSFPEEDCQQVPHTRVTPESLAAIVWEELDKSTMQSLKRAADLTEASCQPWWLEVSLIDGNGQETAMRRELQHMPAGMLWLLIYSAAFFIANGRVCLPDAVPEDQRQNITMMGQSMPIGVAAGNWDSVLVARDVYDILVNEILGYNTVILPSPGTISTLRLLAGCKDSEADAVENCSFPPIAHVGMELWGSSLQSAGMLEKLKLLGERNPEILGSMGYWGLEGMYVLGKARQRALDDAGLHLSYYGNLNASWFHPENYAANLTEVNFTNLRPCDGWTNDPLAAQQYLEATGDAEGVVQQGGTTKFKCWENKWWLPPACRANPFHCMSLITGGNGWGIGELTQQISSHNMPMAFAVATDNAKWREENKKLGGFLYWWNPDSSFVAYNPALVEMPPWSLSEYNQGIYNSQIDRVELHMGIARGFDVVADRAYGLAQNLHISDSIMNELLLILVQSVTPDEEPWQTACTWLRANRILWQEWVPDKTVCSVGRGLVNLQGEFVTSRADAVDCAICPAGHASMEISGTRVCSKCPSGTYQSTFGTSECILCELGTIAPLEGSTHCEQCGLGEYANTTGMSRCHPCGMGSGEEHLWTTSREIISGGGVVVIQLLGAVSQSFCACGAGTFLWDGRCQMCMEGSICPGSNRLELKPGFFSTPEAPGEVYNCFDERICPGGPPGTCSQGRDASTVACAHCQDGFQETGDRTCEPCRNSDYAFIAVVVLVVVCGVGALHITLMNETASKGSSLLVVFSSLTQFITIVQMLSVLRRFDIDWREPFASVLVLLEVLSFDVDMLSMNCVASLNSVALFGFRCLMIPMLMFIALVVHLCYLLRTRSSTFKLGKLLRTMGSIFLILFIVLWSMILAPFQCNEHPNGMLTMKRYKTVFCDGEGEHLEMFILGGLASCMPLFFLALCVWIVVMELPRRVARKCICGYVPSSDLNSRTADDDVHHFVCEFDLGGLLQALAVSDLQLA